MSINVKSFHCDCETWFTAPAVINKIAEEFKETGFPYKEAILKKDNQYIVLYCPKCYKEVCRAKWS